MVAGFVLSVAGGLFVACQLFGGWGVGRAARVYAWAKAFALFPLVPFVLMLLAMFNDHSRDGGGMVWAMLAGVCLAFFVGGILNLIVCALLAGREALRAAQASLEHVPELGLTAQEE